MIRKHWFLVGLATAVPLGLAWPEAGATVRASGALPYLVALTLFISGWLLDARKLPARIARWPVIAACLTTTYVIAPGVGWVLARAFAPGVGGVPDPRFVEAVMIAATQSGTLSSAIALTTVAGGDHEMALVLTVVSNSLTALLTPLALAATIGARVELPVGEMMGRIAMVVLLPVVIGQVARRVRPVTTPEARALRNVAQAIILVFVLCGFGAASRHILEDGGLALRFLGACATLHVGLLVWLALGARLLAVGRGEAIALVFCGSQKTLPNGMFLWERFFATNPWGAVPIVLYHVFQLILDAIIAGRESRRSTRS